MSIHMWAYQNKASPQTDSILNSNSILSSPIYIFYPSYDPFQSEL